jgi:sulfur relay (sulfurtransferase) DsrC/TusE family protein
MFFEKTSKILFCVKSAGEMGHFPHFFREKGGKVVIFFRVFWDTFEISPLTFCILKLKIQIQLCDMKIQMVLKCIGGMA